MNSVLPPLLYDATSALMQIKKNSTYLLWQFRLWSFQTGDTKFFFRLETQKKSGFAEPEIFLGFETDPDFTNQKSECRLKGRMSEQNSILLFCRFEGRWKMFSMYSDKRRCRPERHWSMRRRYKPLQIWRFFNSWFNQKNGTFRWRKRGKGKRKVRILMILRGRP